MSTKIFNAYLYKKDATFTDLTECLKYMNGLRDKFVNWAAECLSKNFSVKDMTTSEIAHKLIDSSQKNEYGLPFDIQLQSMVYPCQVNDTNYIVIHFFPSRLTEKFLEEFVSNELHDFSFEDQTDSMFDLPDFDERDEFYDKLFNDTSIPNRCGFTCDIFYADRNLAFDIAFKIRELEKN